MINDHQIKGIINVSVILAFIPFICFFFTVHFKPQDPILSQQSKTSSIIEIIREDRESGIYFIEARTDIRKLLFPDNGGEHIGKNMNMESGMTLKRVGDKTGRSFLLEPMAAEKRLALGLRIDINQADLEDLILIPGIGEKLAERIVRLRKKLGRIGKIEQLKTISGIKDKKINLLKRYVYVKGKR